MSVNCDKTGENMITILHLYCCLVTVNSLLYNTLKENIHSQ